MRTHRGLSQEALGHAAGLHRNYVGAIERGELNPTIRTTLRLAVGLQVRPSTLVRLAEGHHSVMRGAQERDRQFAVAQPYSVFLKRRSQADRQHAA
jgi:transcriptional regulator with XRE-family HTH domain